MCFFFDRKDYEIVKKSLDSNFQLIYNIDNISSNIIFHQNSPNLFFLFHKHFLLILPHYNQSLN